MVPGNKEKVVENEQRDWSCFLFRVKFVSCYPLSLSAINPLPQSSIGFSMKG